MGRQLSVILWVIGIHLLISTGYGSIAPQTGSCSGDFKDAVPEIHSLSDSSALGSSVMVDLAVDVGDRDGVELPEFNQHVGLQVEARDGGVDLEGLSQHCDPHNVGVRSRGPVLEGVIDDRVGLNQHVDLGPGTSLAEVIESESRRQTGSSGPGAATSSQVIDLESERQRFSVGALVIVPASEVPDLESGRQRGSTTGAGTSSQIIDLESGRQRFSSGAPDIAPYGIWSSPCAGTDSEVPDLESGRQWQSSGALVALLFRRLRLSTLGDGTSSQVIDLESGRQRFSSGASDMAPYGMWSSPWAGTDSEAPDLESRRQWRSSCALDAVPYPRLRWSTPGASSSSKTNMPLSVVAPSSTPSTETHTTQTANTILSMLGLAASAFGFILMIALGLPDHLLWLIGPGIIARVHICLNFLGSSSYLIRVLCP
ncbi:hypothetical protein CMV_002301 [Castanea mollissima]|uniref:Uncharacterized protein n=1 Tax=Castanea mollissima TaxID=60419 RepID=A0A8J4S1V4_9ROSI|nr:hypothetical protein CMV_002301 [Castanea mollissima]